MTKKQHELLIHIAMFIEKNGYSPSQAQLAELMKVKQPTVYTHINGLVARGFIRKDPHIANAIYLTDAGKEKWKEMKK